jgi:mono/diheme cytochrome c family protein
MFAPAITSDRRRGLGVWSIDDIRHLREDRAQSFRSGNRADGRRGREPKQQDESADLQAVAIWLQDQPAPRDVNVSATAGSDRMMTMGAAIYADECSACHTPRGTGIPGLFPALA